MSVQIDSAEATASLEWYAQMVESAAFDNDGFGVNVVDSVNARQTINLAFDEVTIIRNGLGGLNAQFLPPGGGPPADWSFDLTNSIVNGNGGTGVNLEYSPSSAQVLLEEAGWVLNADGISGNADDGVRTQWRVPAGGDSPALEAAFLTLVNNGGNGWSNDFGVDFNPVPDRIRIVNDSVITGNGGAGVVHLGGQQQQRVAPAGAGAFDGFEVSQSIIYRNGGLGIDLSDDGFDTNDALDADEGPNGRLNYPDLVSATGVGFDIDVEWEYDGKPSTEVTLEFYANGHCDPSGYGEAGAFIGSAVVTTDGGGHTEMVSSLPDTPPGQYITATATTDEGTSELSECVKGQGLATAGDADCDEDSDVDDALAILLALEQLGAPPCLVFADVDCDGDVDVADVALILANAAGVPKPPAPDCWPVG